MPGKNKYPPVSYRPTPENRAWLAEQKAAGRPVNQVLNAAVDRARSATASVLPVPGQQEAS